MLSAVRTSLRPLGAPLLRQARFSGGIRILEEAHKAQENLYMHQEDEKLLRKMIADHPELNPEYQGIKNIIADSSHKVEDKVKLIFMKHGIPPINKALISDIVQLIEHEA
mmetsp:Transcript_32889/g.61643  ORF Transcript_32889/g.61643 Transcript_32889/m.61643 type:complete len:110 (-) Transcript_32889:130-459(-)